MRSQRNHIRLCVLLLLIGAARCRQSYDPPAIKAANSYLVIDGFINAGPNAITSFNINRTRNLADSVTAGIPELKAHMTITSSDGKTYPLIDTANTGTYTSIPLNLDNTKQYSIAVTTADGRKYSSDAVTCKQTPPIDSVYWRQPDNLTVYVSTHDPANSTRYYRYDYSETWEHDANIVSPWGLINGNIVATDSTNQKTRCWTTAPSTNVLIASSAALANDVISAFPVATVLQGDPKIDIRYSILVRQYALTEDAYNYWLLIQKTSQGLGTLFDLQPTQLVGNIHCLTNPSEPVIGFLSANSVQQQRIFVYQTYLNNWIHNSPAFGCDTIEKAYNPNDFPAFNFLDTGYGPYYFNGPTVLVLAPLFCLDCTRFGGTSIKPSFWPY
ncbi:MAG TPA: DUF4249 domain-containing protein [Puia sp.]|nr:DUF4249 domain-containing protein [Puia sp.]